MRSIASTPAPIVFILLRASSSSTPSPRSSRFASRVDSTTAPFRARTVSSAIWPRTGGTCSYVPAKAR